VPSNFYSEIPNISDIEASFADGGDTSFDSIFKHDRLVEFLEELFPYSEEFAPPLDSAEPGEFAWKKGPFSFSDAMAYYCIIRKLKPRTIVEIGSGQSTLIADAACKANGTGRIISVEPYPAGFLGSIESVATLLARPVQELPPAFFNEHLVDGDILFIDSTHTVKHGSDCIHLYLKVLPHLTRSVFVHVHDIALPRTFPLQDLRDKQCYWTEQYLLMAYLIENRRTEVLYGSRYHFDRNHDRLAAFMRGRYGAGGGSLWFSHSTHQFEPAADIGC
jgi:hypothetical protein